MDDKEEVVVEQPEQEQSQSNSSSSTRIRPTAEQQLDNVASGMNMTGKALETFGKGEERVANWMDGSRKVGNTTSNVGTAASSLGEKGAAAAEKAAQAKKAAAQTAEGAAKASGTAAKGGKAASKGVQAGGKGTQAAGRGISAIPYAQAAGATVQGVGKGIEGAGRVGEGVSDAGIVASKAAEETAKAGKAAADAELTGAKAAKNAARTAKASNQAAQKATDKNFSDKLRERGKLHQLRGQRIQEQSKKFNSDEVFEKITKKIGNSGKVLKGLAKAFDPKVVSIIFLLLITIGTLLVSYLLSPMFFMKEIENGLNSSLSDPDKVEKVSNFISGLGFQDSESAFYKEVNYLNIHYDKKLDFSYIMSTLYYVDIYYGNNETLTKEDNTNILFKIVRQYLKDSNETIGEDGLTYSANKLYRLRDLATHQMLGNKEPNTMGLLDYINYAGEKTFNELNNYTKCMPLLYLYAVNPGAAKFISSSNAKYKNFNTLLELAEGTTNWEEIKLQIKNGKYTESISSFANMIETVYDAFFNIKIVIKLPDNPISVLAAISGVDFEQVLNSILQVEYYEYEFSETEYENYLVDYYIRKMPEFSELIKGDDGKVDDEKVLQIAYEIRLARDMFKDIYNEDKSAQENGKCIGDINLDLLSELGTPVALKEGQKITFSGTNNYGLYKGKIHQGVDLEAGSTGTKQGDNVYSLYDGKVAATTLDGTYNDKNAKGGWVVIQYTVQYSDSSLGDSKLGEAFKNQLSTILVYYGGLAPSTLSFKQDDVVKKGQVIGKVGTAEDSENGAKSSLHFGIYDVASSRFLNPINMFITCSAGTNDKMCGVTNEQKIWTFLLSKGYSKEVAAAIMGIWERESGLKPYMRQGYFGKESKTKQYTADVDSGKISRKKFINGGKDGYGLAQWTTADRKGNLYDLSKKMGKSIGSVEVQMDFFEQEMNGSYKEVKNSLSKATTIEAAAETFFKKYQGVRKSDFTKYHFDLRVDNAKKIYEKYKNYTCKE